MAGITSLTAANRHLEECFILDYNARFDVPQTKPEHAAGLLSPDSSRKKAINPLLTIGDP
ncbi:MAG: hypothetical protein EXQ92_05850 [Alphaproteobacteria bacterium]|nr:hypothetical protein [Alphaproteobacteria bacterium]